MQAMVRQMGAAWAGDDPASIPAKVDGAILFAPWGALVPPVMEVLDKGGILSIAGIHLSDVPALNYARHLFDDKQIRSVAANTRADGREMFAAATEARVRPHVETFALRDANIALQRMKRSEINGVGVLVM